MISSYWDLLYRGLAHGYMLKLLYYSVLTLQAQPSIAIVKDGMLN